MEKYFPLQLKNSSIEIIQVIEKKHMIFHHPLPLRYDASSGSGVRPVRMVSAFRAIGYEVTTITGTAAERHAAMIETRKALSAGRRYDFCYFENSTMPSALTESHHLPIRGEMDLSFLESLKYFGIPIGAFYRDAQWKLPRSEVASTARWKRRIAEIFYKRELHALIENADILYVPSMEFAEWLKLPDRICTSALPPGAEVKPLSAESSGEFAMMYVGGVSGPIYDIRPFLRLVEKLPDEKFLIVCREAEWKNLAVREKIPENLIVKHAHSSELDGLYAKADLFSIIMGHTDYFDLAMPIKLFDALGRGIPIVASSGTASAEFVKSQGIGWVVDTIDEAAEKIRFLRGKGKVELNAVKSGLSGIAMKNSWESRAYQVANELTALGKAR